MAEKRLAVMIPEHMHRQLKTAAAQKGLTLTELVRQQLERAAILKRERAA